MSFITPNTFLKNKFSASLRHHLLAESQPLAFLLFYYQVFPGQAVDNAVTILRKREKPRIEELAPIRSAVVSGNASLLSPLQWRTTPPERIAPPAYELELDVDSNTAALLDHLDLHSEPLDTYCGAYFGIQTFDREVFVAPNARNQSFRPVIDGTNVKRWALLPAQEFVDFRRDAIKSGGDPDVYSQDRIVVRQIGVFPEGSLCPAGLLTLNTIYNIYEKPTRGRLPFYLGVINSSVTSFYWRLRFFDNKETFPKIKKAPLLSIRIPSASDGERQAIENIVASLSAASAFLMGEHSVRANIRDPLMLAYFEQILNGLVYELYFPDEVHGAGLQFFELVEAANLPVLDAISEAQRLPRLRQLFETLHDGTHPLRIALQKLSTLDTVRILEGKA